MSDPLNLSNSLGFNSPKKKINHVNNTVEAVRDQVKAATTGVAGNFMDQLTGSYSSSGTSDNQPKSSENSGQPPFDFAEFLRLRENRIRQQERNLAGQQQRTETVLFHQKEEQTRHEIKFIQEEILKIIQTTEGVSSELISAEQAVLSNTTEAGTYQLNFFQRIRQLLLVVRKRLSESKHWLEAFNSRSQQKSFYWGQVNKSGTKYMLSQERYMSTQAG